MSYKTILVHLDRKDIMKNRVRIAASLAKSEAAHLLGVSTIGIASTQSSYFYSPQDLAFAEHMKYLRYKAGQFVEEFKEEVKGIGIEDMEGRIVDGDSSAGVCQLGRVSDLIVIGRTNLDDTGASVTPDFPEFVMMNSGRPILIIPPEYQGESVGKKAMICWNGSRESIRAVADALPLLKKADLVQIVMFNVESESDMDSDAGGADIEAYLKRHGVNVEVMPPQKSRDIGKSLLDLAAEQGTDLLVMGGYGHTRFREFLLGGVTRTILESTAVPVLMSH
jgi:nucleotide-binding universal stress UspA family protein